jgi:predicted extracellular nuclease
MMKRNKVPLTPIHEIQGRTLWSELAGQLVTFRGVVTGVSRRGFFIQSAKPGPDPLASDAVYVYSPRRSAPKGALLEVTGRVTDYTKGGNGKPVTQIKPDEVRQIRRRGPDIKPFRLTAENVPADSEELAAFLNSLEGMLVSIDPGQTFIAPSNPYGDYVLALDAEGPEKNAIRTEQGGVLLDHDNPLRWYPGFRISNYARAPRLNVGAKLLSPIGGPLNYRVEAYQILVDHRVKIEDSDYSIATSHLAPKPGFVTIMTMNGFNLDKHVESRALVKDPRQDVDDDWGDGRFHSLARAVVLQANSPDIVALQEIQDNDGAEITEVIDADRTYRGLIETISQLGGPGYDWIDIAPQVGADGGQPGGGIRNGYLYNPERVELVEESVRLIGTDKPAFESSRKPLLAHFREKVSGRELVLINVHMASKRHQRSIFAPEKAGHDERQPVRVKQAEIVRDELIKIQDLGLDYYVTGDFNDTEQSETLKAIEGKESSNLVNTLPPDQRYDYNHRGKLQVLMHGIVPKKLAEWRAEYDIIHGNELLGVQPGKLGDKPSDHAYVLARIKMK